MTKKNIQIINKDDISQEQTKINGNCPKFGIIPRPVKVKNVPSKIYAIAILDFSLLLPI